MAKFLSPAWTALAESFNGLRNMVADGAEIQSVQPTDTTSSMLGRGGFAPVNQYVHTRLIFLSEEIMLLK